jgi:ammonium transporter Rh
MLLLGFGLLMTTSKTNSLTALVYTLLIVAVVVQLYVLFQGFWTQAFTGFQSEFNIFIDEVLLIKASYCVASCLIAMMAVIGRINPTDLIKMATLQVGGYTLNEQIVYRSIGAYDAGGGSVVHTFGAYYGLAVSLVLARYALPTLRPERSYYSNLMALLGTLFLWIFWPFFNFGIQANNSYERTLIVINTYCALAASTVATFIVTAMHGRGLLVEDIQHATLVGGVAIAASCGVVYIPAVASTIGFLAGIISANCLHYLNRKMEKSLKLFDPHCVHSTHGIPGLFGVLASALIIMVYNTGYDFSIAANYSSNSLFHPGTNFAQQGGLQILAALSSLGIALLLGFGTGKFIGLFYEEK